MSEQNGAKPYELTFSNRVKHRGEGTNPELTKVQLGNLALRHGGRMRDYCKMCGTKIATQIYKNSGVCCELCRKDRDGDHGPARIGYVSAS